MKALTALLVLVGVLAANAETTNAPGKVVAIVNAAGLKPEMLQAIKQAAEKSLNVPFETATTELVNANNLATMVSKAREQRKSRYAATVMLVAALPTVNQHARTSTNDSITVVNVTAMSSTNDVVYQSRLLKQVVRGTVFAIGLEPSMDPLCVSRDYRTLAELDSTPVCLFPPWQDRFESLAKGDGVKLLSGQRIPRPLHKATP